MEESPGTRQGRTAVPFVHRAAQAVFLLSAGRWEDEYRSSLLTLNTTDSPQEIYCLSVLTCCPALVLSGHGVQYQIAIDSLSQLSPVGVNSSWETGAVLVVSASKTAAPRQSGCCWVAGGAWAAAALGLGCLPGEDTHC